MSTRPARTAKIERDTTETKIRLSLSLDGTGKYECETGAGFLDHMLQLFASHGRFDLTVRCDGDTHVDLHHTVEDVGIVLGQAFADALGERRGITRYGFMILPMDEALVLASVDLGGRSHLEYALDITAQKVGEFDTELVEEFLLGFVRPLGATLHVRQLAGRNSHHIIEGMFKALARALRQAVQIDPLMSGEIPSTKGLL